MAKCDLCGAHCTPLDMRQLLRSYQIPGVVDLCPSCANWVDKTKLELMSKVADGLKTAIIKKKALPPKRTILQRMFKRDKTRRVEHVS
jgi:hypothetical protein